MIKRYLVTYIGTSIEYVAPGNRQREIVTADGYDDAVFQFNEITGSAPGDVISETGEVERYLVQALGPEYLYHADESGAISGPQEDQR